MSRVEKIEAQIAKLSRAEVREVVRWLAEYDAELWDEQMERDADAGRLDFLFAEADTERKQGPLRKWPPARP